MDTWVPTPSKELNVEKEFKRTQLVRPIKAVEVRNPFPLASNCRQTNGILSISTCFKIPLPNHPDREPLGPWFPTNLITFRANGWFFLGLQWIL